MRTLIAVPCMDMLHTAFFVGYDGMRKVGECALLTCQNSLIYDARNLLGKAALEAGADRILWLDSDVVLPADAMERLSADLDEGYEYASALLFKRNGKHEPIAYDELVREEDENGCVAIEVSTIKDWPENQIFEVAGTGFGCIMMTIDLYKRVYEQYGLPFSPLLGLGEDLSFCWRARKLGAKLYCDTRVKPKHVGMVQFDERYFRKGQKNED